MGNVLLHVAGFIVIVGFLWWGGRTEEDHDAY